MVSPLSFLLLLINVPNPFSHPQDLAILLRTPPDLAHLVPMSCWQFAVFLFSPKMSDHLLTLPFPSLDQLSSLFFRSLFTFFQIGIFSRVVSFGRIPVANVPHLLQYSMINPPYQRFLLMYSSFPSPFFFFWTQENK